MKSEKEKILSGEKYKATDKELLTERIRAKKLVHKNKCYRILGK
jgi:maltose O-acetyltransferase